MKYQIMMPLLAEEKPKMCRFIGTSCFFPFSDENTDYQQFLVDWKNGAEVLNPDGTPAPYVAPETP